MLRLLLTATTFVVAISSNLKAAQPSDELSGENLVETSLPPSQVHEECQRLDQNEKRRYTFKSSGKLEFNIHYHRGKEVVKLVNQTSQSLPPRVMTAPHRQVYCWMWTNKGRALEKLQYRIDEIAPEK